MGDLIQQLLSAEKKAEELIANAKKNRTQMLRSATEKAEEELKDFRRGEEDKFQKTYGSKANVDPAKELAGATQKELQMVDNDYNANKGKTTQYIVSKVLDVPLNLTPTQKQALKT